ncbi:uncharacterized protein EV422DRAFT_571880 [Fimicolochytrium jonesii]|uniref:uncharacterized protein n=1 Tax=Fimicolochytrium jonesii TaxID=1396493 RepID=UPI0022FEA366|nr:uncharacterized protein EV422DRAFT_571880 [Fimicolochytrium jonesii]KAI8816314.1 hypothetical protein EV422DRAFT_571880 [Fimicolochytrium jonesii]
MAVYYPKYTGGGARSRAPVEMVYALLYTPARGVGLDGYRPRGQPIGEVVQGVLAAMGYATSFLQP